MRRVCEYANMRICDIVIMVCFALLPLAGCFSERSTAVVDPGAICSIPVSELKQGGSYVPIRNFAFVVDTLRVKAGARVTWVSCEAPGTDSHTSTSDAGVWSSPLIAPGGSFTRVFDTRGTFPYHCTPHPSMRGVVIVE